MSEYTLSKPLQQSINQLVTKFPEGKQRSAIIMSLRLIQFEHGYLEKTHMNALARHLDLPPIYVYEVAHFYSMYDLKPVGKHKLAVCNSISCHLCGSKSIIDYLGKKLNIKPGETTEDGLFTLKETECLAACNAAPMMMVDETRYEENLTFEKIDKLLEQLRSNALEGGDNNAS